MSEDRSEPWRRRILAVLPNPLKSVRLIFQLDTFMILSCAATFYMTYYIVQVSLPALLVENYSFSETQIGLSYLPISVESSSWDY